MHKRLSVFSMGLVCSSVVFAGAMGPVSLNKSYDGFYIAGDIGVANLVDKESTPYQINLYDRHQFSATGIVGGGMVGYDYSPMDAIKLGVEGFINAVGLNVAAESQYTANSFNANMRYDAGVRLLPGYEFSPGTIGHILLGYAYGKFNINDNGNYGFIDKGISANGFQAGLGVKAPCFSEHLTLRGDAIYTVYGSNTTAGLSPTLTPQNYYNNFATIEGNLSLVYKFS
jgi:hypothetical protein